MEGQDFIKTVHITLEIISFIATIIGMTALFFGYRTHRISYKQLNFQIVDRCTTRFHQVIQNLHKNPDHSDAVAAYLGLCNEEIFYFKHRYLPEDIILEWLEGMTNTVPHWVEGQNINHHPDCVQYVFGQTNLMLSYQRLRRAFTFESVEEYENLKANKKAFLRKVIRNIRKKSAVSEWKWKQQDHFGDALSSAYVR